MLPIPITPGNELGLDRNDIQYLPEHRCPGCGAPAITSAQGTYFIPYQDFFGSALQAWSGSLGYVRFTCRSGCLPSADPRLAGDSNPALRVARLGDAILAIPFVSQRQAICEFAMSPAPLNAERVAQTVRFLARHADPARSGSEDGLQHALHALLAGQIGPQEARRRVEAWFRFEVEAKPVTVIPVWDTESVSTQHSR